MYATRPKRHPSKCFNCNRTGHRAAECRSPQTCRNCRRPGHKHWECPTRQNRPPQRQGHGSQYRPHHRGHSNQAQLATESGPGIQPPLTIEGGSADDECQDPVALIAYDPNDWDETQADIQYFVGDSGASAHMTNDPRDFSDYTQEPSTVHTAKTGAPMESLGYGTVHAIVPTTTGGTMTIKMNRCLYVPELKRKLFSLTAAVEKGITVSLTKEGADLKVPGHDDPIRMHKTGNQFILPARMVCLLTAVTALNM